MKANLRILILSFYFRPDLSAGSFRTQALVDALLPKMPPNGHIDIVTTLPNRYRSFGPAAPEVEEHRGLTVRRVSLPTHRSGLLDQIRAFVVFAYRARSKVSGQHYDLVFATSSRLMTAVLGAWAARTVCAPLYLDIRDIFLDTIKDVLPRTQVFKPLFNLLEGWTVRRAAHVNLVSRGFESYFRARYPTQPLTFFTNGIDSQFLEQPVRHAGRGRDPSYPLTILYAGNIGQGQGLHAILPELAARLLGRARFTIIGDGSKRQELEAVLADAGSSNVELRPPVARRELIAAYTEADVLFLHLNDYDAFRKVLPSKIFEYAAMGKPILAGVAGHCADFLRREIVNAQVFSPCDAAAAAAALTRLELRYTCRDEFVRRFARSTLMHDMADDILRCAGSDG